MMDYLIGWGIGFVAGLTLRPFCLFILDSYRLSREQRVDVLSSARRTELLRH
jgi:hypothetical protein